MDQLNYQEIVDKCFAELKEQGGLAIANDHCLYREPETNRKCFVGMLIADEFYSEDLEYLSPCMEDVQNALQKSLKLTEKFSKKDKYFLKHLQNTHDVPTIESTKNSLNTLKDIYKITITKEQEDLLLSFKVPK